MAVRTSTLLFQQQCVFSYMSIAFMHSDLLKSWRIVAWHTQEAWYRDWRGVLLTG